MSKMILPTVGGSTAILETERLRLSRWGERAVNELVELHRDPRVQKYFSADGSAWTHDVAVQRLGSFRRDEAQHGFSKWRLALRDGDVFIGRAGFSTSAYGIELGYALLPAHWRKGYASEIGLALRDWFLATRSEPGFVAFTHVDNAASERVLARIGMVYTHDGEVMGLPHRFFALERPA